MAKASPAFHKGYAAALAHVHQVIASHLSAMQNGGQPPQMPIVAPPAPPPPPPPGLLAAPSGTPGDNLPIAAPAMMSMKPTPAFPYGRPIGKA